MRLFPMILLALLILPHAIPTVNAVLTVDKTTVYVGDEITLTLNVTNTRDEEIYNLTVYRSVPSGFSLADNVSRVPFKDSLKPNESVVFELKLIAEKPGKLPIEPAMIVYHTKGGEEYVAYSNRVYVTVLDQTQKTVEDAVNTAVKYAAIAAGLSALGIAVALIVRRPKKPRA